jgi:hypothetical protein
MDQPPRRLDGQALPCSSVQAFRQASDYRKKSVGSFVCHPQKRLVSRKQPVIGLKRSFKHSMWNGTAVKSPQIAYFDFLSKAGGT